jgi:hypothetical protein
MKDRLKGNRARPALEVLLKIKIMTCPPDAKVFNGTGAKVDDNKGKTELLEGKIA